MSLDHDLDNLPRLSDDHETIAMPDAAIKHAPSQQSADVDEPKSLEQRIDDQLQALFGAMAMIAITRDSFDRDKDYNLNRVLSDAHKQLEAIGWCLGDISMGVGGLEAGGVSHE